MGYFGEILFHGQFWHHTSGKPKFVIEVWYTLVFYFKHYSERPMSDDEKTI